MNGGENPRTLRILVESLLAIVRADTESGVVPPLTSFAQIAGLQYEDVPVELRSLVLAFIASSAPPSAEQRHIAESFITVRAFVVGAMSTYRLLKETSV